MSTRRSISVAVGFLLAGIVVTPVAIAFAAASAGAGHGGYELAKLFFPYSMLLTLTTGNRITSPLMVLVFAQFPIYGLMLGSAALNGPKLLRITSISIALVHFIAAAACFSGVLPNFQAME